LIGLTLCFISCKPKPTLAVVTTTSVTGITQSTATAGGNVTDDGNVEVTTRGVCWSTSQNPTASSSKTSDGKGTGTFTSNITGLTPGTNYYVRAYAINSEGTSYGNEVTFSSNPVLLATLTTTTPSSITQTTAISGGSITSDGGGAITTRGVCWGTATAPLATGLHTTETVTTATFTSNLTGLTANTKYYIRAYAINSAGTAYGDEKSFTTDQIKTVTDVDGNVYNTVTIGSQIWMAANLKTTRYKNGDLIGTTTPATLNTESESTPKYQWAYAGNESNVPAYGRLYTWYAITDSRGVCPTGWHIPVYDEMLTLFTTVNGSSGTEIADRFKEVGTAHWFSPNTATNSSGFTALPSGVRYQYGEFDALGSRFYFWTSTPDAWYPTTIAHCFFVSGECTLAGMDFKAAISVRCIKD
jgi:uncharacterized protein (TIGR02145 family)